MSTLIGVRIHPKIKKKFEEYCARNKTIPTLVLRDFITKLAMSNSPKMSYADLAESYVNVCEEANKVFDIAKQFKDERDTMLTTFFHIALLTIPEDELIQQFGKEKATKMRSLSKEHIEEQLPNIQSMLIREGDKHLE